MLVTYEALMKDLQSGKFAPVYFLEGEETFFIDKISDYLAEHVLEPSQKDFNYTVLYGKDVDMGTLLSTVQRYPMFADRQLVILREAQSLFGGVMKEKDQTLFMSYLDNPQTSTVLVICHKYKTLDKRLKLGKVIKEKTVFLESPKIKESQLPEWITRLVHQNGFGIEPRTSQLLAEYLGNDLSRVNGELEKLHLLLPAGSTITPEVVEEHIGISKEYNAFELGDAVMRKEFLKCMRIIQYYRHNPSAGPMPLVLASLYNQFSKLYTLHHYANLGDKELASKAGIAPFMVGGLRASSRNYPLSKVEKTLSLLAEYDVKSKGVNNKSADPSDLMTELVYKIVLN